MSDKHLRSSVKPNPQRVHAAAPSFGACSPGWSIPPLQSNAEFTEENVKKDAALSQRGEQWARPFTTLADRGGRWGSANHYPRTVP